MKEKIIEIIREIAPNFDANSSELVKAGILTSLDILQIIAAIDDELDIAIPAVKIKPEYFNSVDGIVKLLKELNEEE